MENANETAELLIAWKDGSKEAFERLIPLVECDLRRIARAQIRREKENHILQTTALINEAYLKLVDATGIEWQNRTQFFGISATIMLRILINYARDSKAGKRGAEHVAVEDAVIFTAENRRS